MNAPETVPQRVISLLGSYGEVWQEAGGTLIATTEDAAQGDVVSLGSHSEPNMELLLALNPDFVILSADTAAHPAVGDLLESAGIPHGYFSMQTWQGYMDMMETFTQITGRDDLYANAETTVQQPIGECIAAAQSHPDFGKKTALLLRAYVTSVKAKGSEGTVAGPILREMGLVNIADSDRVLTENLTLEAILAADPDYIFAVTMGADQEGAEKMLEDALLSNPAWNTLTAVREGRFVVLDRDLFHLRPNGRWAEAYETIYEIVYEDPKH
jgi:iron complex transport system substrate-binding protein